MFSKSVCGLSATVYLEDYYQRLAVMGVVDYPIRSNSDAPSLFLALTLLAALTGKVLPNVVSVKTASRAAGALFVLIGVLSLAGLF